MQPPLARLIGEAAPTREFHFGFGDACRGYFVAIINVVATHEPGDVEVMLFVVDQDHAMSFHKEVAVGQYLENRRRHCGLEPFGSARFTSSFEIVLIFKFAVQAR